jgi:hypothetical protein
LPHSQPVSWAEWVLCLRCFGVKCRRLMVYSAVSNTSQTGGVKAFQV